MRARLLFKCIKNRINAKYIFYFNKLFEFKFSHNRRNNQSLYQDKKKTKLESSKKSLNFLYKKEEILLFDY